MKVSITDAALPCGCRPIGNAVVLGINAEHVEAVVAADPDAGLLWVYRHVVEPELVKRGPYGTIVKREGVEVVVVTAPFELHCRNHPADSPTWRDYQQALTR